MSPSISQEWLVSMQRMLDAYRYSRDQRQSLTVLFEYLADTRMMWRRQTKVASIVHAKLCELSSQWGQAAVFLKLLFPQCGAGHEQRGHEQPV